MSKKKGKKNGGSKMQKVTLCISTAMVLIMLGLVTFIGLTAQNMSQYVKENLTVTVMFDKASTNRETVTACNRMRKKPYVTHLDYISPEQALKEQTKALGTDPREFAGMNPFTASAELHLKADCANNDSLKWITKELKAFPKVTDVTCQKDLVDKVNKTLHKIMLVMLAIAVLLTFVSFSLINNTVKLGVYARRFSINTMKLVGASWGFIRRPFMTTAIVQGLVAGIIADAVLAGCIYGLFMLEPDMLTVVTWQVLAITGGAVLLFGIFISSICVWVSVNKFLRMSTKKLYRI